MAEPITSASPPARPSTRRVVLLTLAVVALVGLLAGGGVFAYLAWDRQSDRLADARAENRELVEQLETARSEIRQVSARLVTAQQHASDEYLRGLEEGRKSEQEIDAEFGLDYDSGYNDAFEGFGGWETDAYYIVLITQGEKKLKYSIERRTDMQPCTLYLIEGSSLFTRPDPAC